MEDKGNKSGGYVVAIDLGSSKLVGVLAHKTSNQEVNIIASMVEPTDNCIRRGCVYNVNDVTAKINKIIKGLEEKSHQKIDKIYVNLNGRSLRSEVMIPERSFEEGESITENDIESIQEQIKENRVPEYEILQNTEPQYFVDEQLVSNPVGVVGLTLSAPYLSIIALPSLKMNISKSIQCVNNVGYVIGPLATAQVILTENEKQAGVAMIDFGGGCTSLVIYKNGQLRHLAVIPFGGDNITKDLCTLNFNQEMAERLKARIGCLKIDAESQKVVSTGNGEEVLETKISQVIRARQGEILKNVLKQLSSEELERELVCGIVVTGGASKIPGLFDFIRSIIPQRLRSTTINIKQSLPYYPKGVKDEFKAPEYSALHGLLYVGAPDCVRKVEEKEPETPKEDVKLIMEEERKKAGEGKKKKSGTSWKDIIKRAKGSTKRWNNDLFSTDDDKESDF